MMPASTVELLLRPPKALNAAVLLHDRLSAGAQMWLNRFRKLVPFLFQKVMKGVIVQVRFSLATHAFRQSAFRKVESIF